MGPEFLDPKWPICPEQIFFLVQTIIITLIYLLSLFCCVKFKKILTANPEFWGCTIFGPKIVHLPQTIFFYWKIINICLIYLLASFIVQNLKKFFQQIQSYEEWPISQNDIFFRKTYQWALFLSFMSIYRPKIKVKY